MDKSAAKNFAARSRKKLKEQIEQKAYALGITKGEVKKAVVHEDLYEVNGNKFHKSTLNHKENLVRVINEKGFDQVIEEAAYTWFNRFIAIRFMEINEYLPVGIRVLSSSDPFRKEPDIIREVLNAELDLDAELVYRLQDENKTEELFKYILIKQCNEFNEIMPVVFEKIQDYTELLLPDNLLQEGSVLSDLISSIPEEDFKEQVEIIGWVYQYYIAEKKEEVFEDLKRNIKVSKENIPAATQLFTPDWIVKYMVENSLGRLWLEAHPDEELKSKWKYYLEEAEQELQVQVQLKADFDERQGLRPEDIKFLDPSMGSGHVLVYAFDVFYDIYKSSGYPERDIPKLILENNLYGLDIDDRAAQLAYFAIMMKARSYNRRIFREKLKLNICSIKESNAVPKEALNLLSQDSVKADINYLIEVFKDAKEYGSVLDIRQLDFDSIERELKYLENIEPADLFQLQYKNVIMEKIPELIKQARIMSGKYHIVCTNPPYMGRKSINDKLSTLLNEKYPNSKSDLYTVFIEKCMELTLASGYTSMVTMHSWMFLSTYESLRKHIIDKAYIQSMVHIGAGGFEELNAFNVLTTAFCFGKRKLSSFNGTFIRLVSYYNPEQKKKEFYNKDNVYFSKMNMFLEVPGVPFIYWISNNLRTVFSNSTRLGDISEPKVGLQTGSNEEFVRYWFEVAFNNIGFEFKSREAAKESSCLWFPYHKGGEFRKWYGNNDYVVNWKNDGEEIKNFTDKNGKLRSRPQNQDYYFKTGITWSLFGFENFGVRYKEFGFIFDVSSSSMFPDEDLMLYILAFLTSSVAFKYLSIIAPTVNFQAGNIGDLPIIIAAGTEKAEIEKAALSCIGISKEDWDRREYSWHFKGDELIRHRKDGYISSAYESYHKAWSEKLREFVSFETAINKRFIQLYNAENEIAAEVLPRDISILKDVAEINNDYTLTLRKEVIVKNYISYFVGCAFGRFSLDEEGLIYAGGVFNPVRYKSLKVDLHNVIPITDEEYFEDDIVSKFVKFVIVTFGEEHLEENLDFIAEALGKKFAETSRQAVRRYFLKDFYKDHIKNYNKRPIYWMFDSGKNDGFKSLIYMHRYEAGSLPRMRIDYVHVLQKKYQDEIGRMNMIIEGTASPKEKSEAKKKKEKLQKQILECMQYDQVLAHAANQKIVINLDDGISANYSKFPELLSKI